MNKNYELLSDEAKKSVDELIDVLVKNQSVKETITPMPEIKNYTVSDFIQRLLELPGDLPIKGYMFQTDNGEVRNTFTMGKIK